LESSEINIAFDIHVEHRTLKTVQYASARETPGTNVDNAGLVSLEGTMRRFGNNRVKVGPGRAFLYTLYSSERKRARSKRARGKIVYIAFRVSGLIRAPCRLPGPRIKARLLVALQG